MPAEWSNWSGSVHCAPRRMESPATEQALVALVREAARDGLSVRVVGTGHSFMPIAATDGVLISLDDWKGIESHDADRREATVRAGTKLTDLGGELLALGLAMENIGDVDVQSVGGAIGTGTHGTGRTLGNLSTHVTSMRLATAAGDLRECSAEREPDLLRAARVSMGMLGVISTTTLRLQPAFRLHERVWRLPMESCLEQLDHLIAGNTRFEFFWYPVADEASCKTLNPTDGEPNDLGDVEGERIGWSAHVIPSIRVNKFNEMEYAVPAEAGPACFRLVRARMRARHSDVAWPVEYRTLAADDAWLSPAHGRATVTISIHQDARLPFRDFFADIEAIFRDHRGRPHWGKIHYRSAAELRDLYPMWDRFTALRQEMDPVGRFLNVHLAALFGTT
jgi:FAD/FMN-containing dehydrogenase